MLAGPHPAGEAKKQDSPKDELLKIEVSQPKNTTVIVRSSALDSEQVFLSQIVRGH